MIENYVEYVRNLVKQAEENLWENYYLEEPKQKVNIREILENLGWTTIDDRNFHTPMVCAMSFYKPYLRYEICFFYSGYEEFDSKKCCLSARPFQIEESFDWDAFLIDYINKTRQTEVES